MPSSGPHSIPPGELAQNQRCPSEPVDPGEALESGVFSESCFQFLLEVEKGSFRDLLVWIKVKSETRLVLIANVFGLSDKIVRSHTVGSASPGSWQSHCIPGELNPRGPSPVPRVPEAPALQRPKPACSHISQTPGVMTCLLLEEGKEPDGETKSNAFQMSIIFRIRERLASGPVIGATASLLKIISSLSC